MIEATLRSRIAAIPITPADLSFIEHAKKVERRIMESFPNPIPEIFLVSCVSVKRRSAAPARELYASDWFRKARAYVERRGSSWFILSAKHGLVSPDQVIKPYNVTLKGQPKAARKDWAAAVAAELAGRIEPGTRIIILAGALYRDELVPLLVGRGFRVLEPLATMGLGEQKQFLKRLVEELGGKAL